MDTVWSLLVKDAMVRLQASQGRYEFLFGELENLNFENMNISFFPGDDNKPKIKHQVDDEH